MTVRSTQIALKAWVPALAEPTRGGCRQDRGRLWFRQYQSVRKGVVGLFTRAVPTVWSATLRALGGSPLPWWTDPDSSEGPCRPARAPGGKASATTGDATVCACWQAEVRETPPSAAPQASTPGIKDFLHYRCCRGVVQVEHGFCPFPPSF